MIDDEIKGNQDLKICSHSDSLILSLQLCVRVCFSQSISVTHYPLLVPSLTLCVVGS